MLRIMLSYSRVCLPLMLGICIGIALSFMVLPLVEEGHCDLESSQSTEHVKVKRWTESPNWYMQRVDFDSFRNSDYQLNLMPSRAEDADQTNYKPVRQRFMRSEVSMSDILMLGYMTNKDNLDTLAIALHKTAPPTAKQSSLRFFMASRMPTTPSELSVISFSLLDSRKLVLLIVKYFSNLLKTYPGHKYYALLPDSTYVKFDAVKAGLLPLTGWDYIGFSENNHGAGDTECDTAVGIILSAAAVRIVGENIGKCEQLFDDGNLDAFSSLDKCIKLIMGKECIAFPSSATGRLMYEKAYGSLLSATTTPYERSFVISNLKTAQDVYKIRRSLARQEMLKVVDMVQEGRNQLMNLYQPDASGFSHMTPGEPLIPQPYRTTNRYDVLRWTLAADNLTYLEYDYDVDQPLKVDSKADLDSMVKAALEYVNTGTESYKLIKVLHAYSRVDPTRGMDYRLTLLLHDTIRGISITKEFEAIKPRAAYLMIPQPSGGKSTPVYIIIPFVGDDTTLLDTLINTFLDVFMREPNIYLRIAIGESHDNSISHHPHTVKYHVQRMVSKLGALGKIDCFLPKSSTDSTLELLNQAIVNSPKNVIVFTSTLATQLTPELLTHIRSNTIAGIQAYAPIGFWEYRPELIYDNQARPARVEVSRNVGHLGELWFDHISIYSDDYRNALSIIPPSLLTTDIFSVISSLSNFTVMRAVDPELRISNQPPRCEGKPSIDASKCYRQTLDNKGSAALLAKKMLSNGQIGVSHR